VSIDLDQTWARLWVRPQRWANCEIPLYCPLDGALWAFNHYNGDACQISWPRRQSASRAPARTHSVTIRWFGSGQVARRPRLMDTISSRSTAA